MKLRFTLCLVLSFYFGWGQENVHAQGHEFALVGAKWYYGIQEGFSPDEHYRTVEVIKDTLITGMRCAVVEINEHYASDETLLSGYEYLYCEQKKVYRRDNAKQSFYLLYDFSANTGDSWDIQDANNPDEPTTVYVDSIKQIDVSGVKLKQLFISTNTLSSFRGSIIERIGGEGYLFLFPYAWIDVDVPSLRCYSDNEINYKSPNSKNKDCEQIITDLNRPQLEIQISLISDGKQVELQIPSRIKIKQIRLYDMKGKSVVVNEMKNNRIDIEHLPPGVYLLKILTKEQEMKSFKIYKS